MYVCVCVCVCVCLYIDNIFDNFEIKIVIFYSLPSSLSIYIYIKQTCK